MPDFWDCYILATNSQNVWEYCCLYPIETCTRWTPKRRPQKQLTSFHIKLNARFSQKFSFCFLESVRSFCVEACSGVVQCSQQLCCGTRCAAPRSHAKSSSPSPPSEHAQALNAHPSAPSPCSVHKNPSDRNAGSITHSPFASATLVFWLHQTQKHQVTSRCWFFPTCTEAPWLSIFKLTPAESKG